MRRGGRTWTRPGPPYRRKNQHVLMIPSTSKADMNTPGLLYGKNNKNGEVRQRTPPCVWFGQANKASLRRHDALLQGRS